MKLRRGEGSVSQYTLADGSVRWRARWWENDRQRSKTCVTEQEARALLIESGTDKRLGRHTHASLLTVRQACEQYINRNADRWSTNTVASYRQVAKSHVYPYLGNESVSTLSTSQAQEWIDKLVRKKLAQSTVDHARVVLRGMFGDLVRLGDVPRNPVVGVRLPARKRSKKEVWSESEVREVVSTANRMYPMMAVYYKLALSTGMRPGEIRALKWSDIDLVSGVITCQRTVTRDENFRQIVGTNTKTHRARSIAVPASTVKALQDHRKSQVERRLASELWAHTDLVLDRGDGHLVAQQTIRNRHVAICREADVPICRMHDLRHCAATLLLKAGVNVKIVSEILGHSNISMTLDTYSHVSVDMQRAATDLLGEIVSC